MKKWLRKIFPVISICLIGIAAVMIGTVYFHFTSQKINADSTKHLMEIYGQVNHSFGAFVERNWGLLQNWGDYFALPEESVEESVSDLIEKEKDYWGFTEFYFLSAGKTYRSLNGKEGPFDVGNYWNRLIEEKKPVVVGKTLQSGQNVTVFAAPTPAGEYRGFSYDAIAISYTNADLARSLDVDAFAGEGTCLVIHNDGVVLLSTQDGGNVYDNYLVYLKAVSDLDADALAQMEQDWHNGVSGIVQCDIGDVAHCILYQPVGYQDYTLLSVVPQSAVSAGFLSVQNTTIRGLVLLFLIAGAMVIGVIIQRAYRLARRNKMELQYRDLMFDVLSNNVDDIFLMLDLENESPVVDYISPNLERLIGIPAEKARKNIRIMEQCAINGDVLIPRGELAAIPLRGNICRECEYRHQSTGERRWYRMSVYHMGVQDAAKFIIVMSDRTQERKMNQTLQEALTAAKSANEAKSNFLSNMSHDIRTPMNAIVGFSVLLEKDADQPEKVREYTRKITASSHHLLSLINDVLDMSKIESGKTSLNVDRFRLPDLLEELNIILMPQAKAKNQCLKIYVQGTPPEQLLGDKLRLNQILLNLLSNAIKYTQVGGKIDFVVSEVPALTQQYVKLRFTVRDNGIGMSEEFQKQIFAPFSRENNTSASGIQGTGLGMAITKNLVDLMGGIIQVESQPGKGSTFTVELSFVLPEQTESDSWFRQKVTRMLVADDEEEICLDIRELMRDTGVEVSYVTDGAAAVKTAVDAHRRGEDFHVILLDWKMPGLNGVESARQIREQVGADIPILVLTSYDWSDIEAEARAAGINAFMPKPFFTSTFWQTIKPLFLEHTEQKQMPEVKAESVMDGRLFLVAEDNSLNAEILTEMLHMEGARCELAVNGQEAVEMFQKSDPGYYDMILMDVQMPIMNGYEATRQIRACAHPQAKTIPIAAMTANTFAEDVRNALNAGMNGHLAKPIDMNTVRQLVGQLLNQTIREGGDHK